MRGMPFVVCGTCSGSGLVTVTKTDKKGNSVTVNQECGSCRGSGVIPT